MRKKTIEKHKVQRDTVLAAAAKMFSERGFAGASLNDVAKDLDISRPALYYYFSSKQEILSSLVDEVSVKINRIIKERISKSEDVVTKFYDMTYETALFVMRNTTSYMVVIKTEDELVDETRALNLEAKKASFEAFKAVIQEGVDAGRFRKLDSGVAALGIIGMCNWCAWWFKDAGRLSDKEVANQIAQMALASLVVPDRGEGVRQDIAKIADDLGAVMASLRDLEKKY